MTDTGYDPNQHAKLLRASKDAASRAQFALHLLDEGVDAWLSGLTDRFDRDQKDDEYRVLLSELEDAWRAENDYMKRATAPLDSHVRVEP